MHVQSCSCIAQQNSILQYIWNFLELFKWYINYQETFTCNILHFENTHQPHSCMNHIIQMVREPSCLQHSSHPNCQVSTGMYLMICVLPSKAARNAKRPLNTLVSGERSRRSAAFLGEPHRLVADASTEGNSCGTPC